MQDYVICLDASGDISEEIAGANNIEFVPMEYSLGSEMRTSHGCEPDDVLKRFYDGQRNGDLTKTSQISPFMYESFFEPFLKEGKSVIYLCLSSGLSSTYQSSMLAASNLKDAYPDQDVFVVDTLGATGGLGLLGEIAIENKKQGMSAKENFEALKVAVPQARYIFVVQDLMYLMRGGRLSAATAVVGSVLNIKPILMINEEGKLINVNKKRGNKAAINALYDYFVENYAPEKSKVVYMCHGDADDIQSMLESKIRAAYPDVEIRKMMLTPIIGAHTGPGMASCIFMGK